MTIFIEHIKKLMGWYPSVNSWICKLDKPVDFAYPPISPIIGRMKDQPIRSGNVIFPANGSLFTLYFVIGFSFLLHFSRYLDYPILIMSSIAICGIYYLLAFKTFQASISIDENGIHYNSFRLKDITVNYRDIKSIKSFKWDINNNSKKTRILIIVFILILALSVIFKEWKVIAIVVPLLPMIFLLEREQQKRYHGLDTQLYIESRTNKWWYELSQYYSVITDRITADRIRASIEKHMRVS